MKYKKILIIIIVVLVFYFLIKLVKKENDQDITIETIDNNENVLNKIVESDFCLEKCSPVSGLFCENYNRRGIMVMLSADEEARPLSGLKDADMILEMPVVKNGITRFAALYICNLPAEIGSIRSSRDDFIPIAKGLDAIYVHWGGSHFALDELANGVIDNIDALTNPFNIFYRKKEIYAPHNGFTSNDRLEKGITKLGYRFTNNFMGYPHVNNLTDVDFLNYPQQDYININYSQGFKVEYQYDASKNAYKRTRNNIAERDALHDENIYAKIVVIIEASSEQLEGQYNNVDVVGEGVSQIFQNGVIIEGKWKKKSYDSKLYFYNDNGEEIPFLPGQIWVQIIEPENNIY